MAEPRSRTRRSRERGNVTLTASFGMMSLVGFMALALDVGMLHYRQRDMRTAADAGALAAGAEIQRGNLGLIIPSAMKATDVNGFKNGTGGVAVTVNPAYLFNGSARFAQVTISQPVRTAFMGLFGKTEVPVSVRAVAGMGAKAKDCAFALQVLGPALRVGESLGASSNLILDCGIRVNSIDPTALITGPGSTLSATEISVTGGFSGSVAPTPVVDVPAVPDPLAHLPAPSVGGCGPDDGVVTSSRTLDPGVYCSGINVTSGATATLNPGEYILQGGLTVNDGNISGTDVMFYNDDASYAPITITGDSTVDLSAATTGNYSGVLFFQDRRVPSGGPPNVFDSTGAMDLNGVLYFSTSTVQIGSSSLTVTATITGGVVAETIVTDGDSTVNIDVWVGASVDSPLKRLTLVE